MDTENKLEKILEKQIVLDGRIDRLERWFIELDKRFDKLDDFLPEVASGIVKGLGEMAVMLSEQIGRTRR